MFPLDLQQGSRASSGVAAETWGSSLVVAGNSGFPRELPQGTENSSQTAARNKCSSEFAAQDAGFRWIHGTEFGVLLELGWYSGFLATCGGASCRVLFGRLISSRDVHGGLCLVAVTGGCSLVLKRDFSIIVVGVNSVVAGAMILSSCGVPVPLSLRCEVRLS